PWCVLPRSAGEIAAITGDVDAGEHDFTVAVAGEAAHLRHDVIHRQRTRIAASVRNDAEGAAVVAAVLHLHEGAHMAFDAVDAVRRHHPRRHDVGDGDFFVRLPVAGVELFLVADDAIHFRHGGESRGFRLCGTAGDDDARGRPLTLDVTDALARLAHRFRRHRTGVHHNRVAQTSGA